MRRGEKRKMGNQSAEQKKGLYMRLVRIRCGEYYQSIGNGLREVPADEILAHRIVWAFVFMLIVLGVTKRFRQFIGEFMNLF